MPDFRDRLAIAFKARVPVLYVESFEEQRVLSEVTAVAGDSARVRTPRKVVTWSATQGLCEVGGEVRAGTQDAAKALGFLLRATEPTVFVFRDLHAALGDGQRPPDPVVVRLLRDVAASFKQGDVARALVLVSPVLRIPPELEKDVSLVDFDLPGEDDIRALLDSMVRANSQGGRIRVDIDDVGLEKLAKAALGLTLHEAENAFARAMVSSGRLHADDVAVVFEEKRQTIRRSGLLEFVPVDVDLEDVGGLGNLKRWLLRRNGSWLAEGARYALPAPKGVLITGVPGCGKSLTAKAIAASWGLPLLRLDVGKVFAGLIGSSEQNMRTAIRTAEATAPCVLWIDEIEKGFAGLGSRGGAGDSGTSLRVFASFLTWMQEKDKAVFVIATANSIDALPPEFLRKGRFDEIFFVDLPTEPERVSIWAVHLQRRLRGRDVAAHLHIDDELTRLLARISEGYSGAEIEQCVIAALFDAFAERRLVCVEDLVKGVRNMVPLSVTQAEQINQVRAWAAVRAVAATSVEDRAQYGQVAGTGPDGTPGADGSPGHSLPGVDAVALSRGGRMVDF